jgi:hypothetical protein
MLLNIIFGLLITVGLILSAVGARSLRLNEESLSTFKTLSRTTYIIQKIDILEGEIRLNLVCIAFGIMIIVGSMVMITLNL